MKLTDKIHHSRLYFDGGTGSILQSLGLNPGELPELWNLTHESTIYDLHCAYLKAGANIIKTNTFGANSLKLDSFESVIEKACSIAKKAVSDINIALNDSKDRYVAFDIGPLGRMLKPLGDMDFEEAIKIFAQSIRVAAKCGVDLILIETMSDSLETKAAVLAAKENSSLPVFVTNVYDENEKLMTGSDPESMVAMLEGLRVDALGINCSLGPRQMKNVVSRLIAASSLPIIVNPNAGLPCLHDNRTCYSIDAVSFAEEMHDIAMRGASILGGCCGTTPEYIAETIKATSHIPFEPIKFKNHTRISSYSHTVSFGDVPKLIGERLNPTGKPRLKEALTVGNMDYILNEAISQQERGADVLDVNVGLPGINEAALLQRMIPALQEVTDLPLSVDTVDPVALEAALRCYNGKALVNSVNGKPESMNSVFPLVAKYGGVVIALTLDENGIPSTPKERCAIAKRIVDCAAKYGIPKKDLIIDALSMTISSDNQSACTTLNTIKLVKEKLELKTVLGVSNISFGLPNRDFVTSSFFAMALACGLDAAIMNPNSAEMMKTYRSCMALMGKDADCLSYISFASGIQNTISVTDTANGANAPAAEKGSLEYAIIKGLKDQSYLLAKELLKSVSAVSLIDSQIIPALNTVGHGFEEKRFFLPQLLLSAEAAKSAFNAVKESLSGKNTEYGKIILATVKGDIHDIGKNIVKVLLENYGFSVVDLGRDVSPEAICHCVEQTGILLVGLSALMTTTVPAMEETIRQLRRLNDPVKIVVGGAVMTEEYAKKIGADRYAKDAMETVRYAQEIYNIKN